MSALDDLITNLQTIHTETMDKIIPENIRSGVTIFGVTGTVVPYRADPNLSSENIRAGVTIFGVTGTYDGTDSEPEAESVTSD